MAASISASTAGPLVSATSPTSVHPGVAPRSAPCFGAEIRRAVVEHVADARGRQRGAAHERGLLVPGQADHRDLPFGQRGHTRGKRRRRGDGCGICATVYQC